MIKMILFFESIAFLLIIGINLHLLLAKESINHPGHGKKFGSSGPFLDLDQAEEISTQHFFASYVRPKKPVLIRNAVKEFPAFKLWTDEYLYNIALKHDNQKLVIETEKKNLATKT